MKKLLLSAAVVAAIAAPAGAKNWLYEPEPNYGLEEVGQVLTGGVTCVSPNGRYAVSNDGDAMYHIGSLWCVDEPSDFVILPQGGVAYGVSNDGVVVGVYYGIDGDFSTQHPGYYENGVWHPLPVADDAYNDGATAEARAITPDGKFISGHQSIAYYDEDIQEERAIKVPCLWSFNKNTEEYDLTAVYRDPAIGNQGFIVTCMSDDGSIIAGMLTCGAGSSTVPAMIKNGKLVVWDEFETREIPFEFKGEIIGYYPYYFINGHVDVSGADFVGSFRSFTADGKKIIGYRTIVTDIVKDAEGDGLDAGTLHLRGFSYDIENDEFTDSPADNTAFFTAYPDTDGEMLYFGVNSIYKNNRRIDSPLYHFEVDSYYQAGAAIYSISTDGKILGGATATENAETGDVFEIPMVIVLEEGLGTNGIGMIETTGDNEITIYDLNGMVVGRACNDGMNPGIYVVKSGNSTKKVLVK